MTSQNDRVNDTLPENAAPTVLAGRYRVVRQLGQGGMGSVWLAEDKKLDGRKVAIKMLPSILVSNKRAYAQVKAEALVSLKLSHPNIATVRGFEEDNGNPFLVMDYIDGQTLDDCLAEKGNLSEEETIRLLKPVAAALDYAHTQGVVHRDVKPGNVMIDKSGHPYVLDFGIAREIQETMTRVTGKLSSGTLMYMSPEQLNGASPKPAQDVYSFAAMAYECLKGEPPFSRGQIEFQIINNEPEPLGPQFSKCGPGVMAGLAKTPEARPTTCAAVLVDNNGGTRFELRKDVSQLVDGPEEAQRLLDARCVGHRVKLKMSVWKWAAFLVVALYVLCFLILSNCLFSDAQAARSKMRSYYEQGKETCFRYAAAKEDLLNTQGLLAFGGALLLVAILCLFFRFMLSSTRRSLQSFHKALWVDCVKSRLFSFSNDDWMLYVRACCAYFGLATDRKDEQKAVSLFSRAADAGNPEAMYAMSVVAGTRGDDWRSKANAYGSVLVRGRELGSTDKIGVNGTWRITPENLVVSKWIGARLFLRGENLFWLVVWSGLGVLCAIESAIGVNLFDWHLCSDEFTWLFNLSYGLPALAVAWHVFKYRNTWNMYCAFCNGSAEGVLGQRFAMQNDRDVLFWVAWANLFSLKPEQERIEKACDFFERSATAGNSDAYAALTYLSVTGRTKRYNAAYTRFFRSEAVKRGSKLMMLLEERREVDRLGTGI